MGVKCFFLEETDVCEVSLRRFSLWQPSKLCPVTKKCCDASTVIARESFTKEERKKRMLSAREIVSHSDPRWPVKCVCGYVFDKQDNTDDVWQVNDTFLFRRRDCGELLRLDQAPPGAMRYVDWMLTENSNEWRGPDGHSLMVRCPDGTDWCIDSRANNCDMKDDHTHKCWIRHGDPPRVTVDKNGVTCGAGSGSILTHSSKYHGFLRNGEFTE